MGKSLIMKNNMKSLVNSKSQSGKARIDHEQGGWEDLDNLDCELSRMGYYGKDLSDSVVASIMLADLYGTDHSDYIWNEEIEYKKKNDTEFIIDDIKKKFNLHVRLGNLDSIDSSSRQVS